jgi:hypothetical protein
MIQYMFAGHIKAPQPASKTATDPTITIGSWENLRESQKLLKLHSKISQIPAKGPLSGHGGSNFDIQMYVMAKKGRPIRQHTVTFLRNRISLDLKVSVLAECYILHIDLIEFGRSNTSKFCCSVSTSQQTY